MEPTARCMGCNYCDGHTYTGCGADKLYTTYTECGTAAWSQDVQSIVQA